MSRYNPLKPTKTAVKPRPVPLPQGTIPNAEPVSGLPTLTENDAKDGLELSFPIKPPRSRPRTIPPDQTPPPRTPWALALPQALLVRPPQRCHARLRRCHIRAGRPACPPAAPLGSGPPIHQYNNPAIRVSLRSA